MKRWIDEYAFGSKTLRILVVGDSIGDGSCATVTQNKWTHLLTCRLKEEFGIEVTLTNLSVGGTASLFGYHRIHSLSSNVNFDLIFVCFGENDAEEDFALYYEVLLRTIRLRWPNCRVVSILESSQKDYTSKMHSIRSLAEKYGCAVCDTIAAFKQSSMDYEMLTVADGIHLNDEGQKVYSETAYRTVIGLDGSKISDLPEANADVLIFDRCRFIKASEMQYGLADYRLRTTAKYVAFNCLEAPESATYKVFSDDREILSSTFKHPFYFVWERLHLLNVPEGEKEIRVTLSDETDVCLYKGILLIGEDCQGNGE